MRYKAGYSGVCHGRHILGKIEWRMARRREREVASERLPAFDEASPGDRPRSSIGDTAERPGGSVETSCMARAVGARAKDLRQIER
jgi:hypothetical protein